MAYLCNTKQEENELTHAFIKGWLDLSYKCPDAPSHKAIVGLCRSNLKIEVRSLILQRSPQSLAKLIEAAHDVESVLKELENPSKQAKFSFPAIIQDD